jgi:hypothetical protein
MNKLFAIVLTVPATTAFGQINMEDSTAQVISYWNIGDKQSYSISLQKIKQKGTDTSENVLMTYDVDITVIDSAENSYLVEWFYKNYKTNSTNEIVKKITALSEDIKVVMETDEFGAIKGVKNWKEVSEYMKTPEPKKEDIGQLTNITTAASRIHGTGWLIYSIQTKTVEAPEATSIEERIMEIK